MTLRPELNIDAYNEIGIIESLQGRYDAAAAAFQKAIDLDSNHTKTTELAKNLASVLKKLGRDTRAGEDPKAGRYVH
jgi:tetratricopeptide (TPR) repeat protein